METLIIFLPIATFYIISDLVQMIKEKQWKIGLIYTIMLSIDLIIALLIAMDIPIASPLPPIKTIINSFFGL